jgi:hypothetical protein
VSQEVVYIEPGDWATEGYGKGGKLKCAFHLSHNPGCGYELEYVEVSNVPRAKALVLGVAPIGTAEAVPFQNNGWKGKQRIETSQLKPWALVWRQSARLKPCPFKTTAGRVNNVLKLHS